MNPSRSSTMTSTPGAGADPSFGGVDTLSCLYCQASIHFVGLPAHRYNDHLFKEHNIMYDVDAVVERTLKKRFPGYRHSRRRARKRKKDDDTDSDDSDEETKGSACQLKHVEEKLMLEVAVQVSLGSAPSPAGQPVQRTSSSGPYSSPPAASTAPKPAKPAPPSKVLSPPPPAVSSMTKLPPGTPSILSASMNPILSVKPLSSETLQNVNIVKLDTVKKEQEQEQEPEAKEEEPEAKEEEPEAKEEKPEAKKEEEKPEAEEEELESKQVAIYLPWYSGCEYRCQVCRDLFYYVHDLRKHVRKKHGSPDEYLDKYVQFETKAVYLQCKLCRRDVKRNFQAVTRHLQDKHEAMTVDEYGQLFKLRKRTVFVSASTMDEEQQKTLERIEARRENRAAVAAALPTTTTTLESSTAGASLTFDMGQFQSWKSQCEYRCKICPSSTFTEYSNACAHVRNLHMPVMDYKAKHGELCTKKVLLKCQLCFKKVLCSGWTLKKHFQHLHSMTVKEYYRKYVANNGSGGDGGDGGDKKAAVPGKESQISIWSNQCHYACRRCPYESNKRKGLLMHIRKTHKMLIAKYLQLYKQLETRSKSHTCKICQKDVLFDFLSLSMHVRQKHAVSLANYYHRFVVESSTGTISATSKAQNSTSNAGDEKSQADSTSRQSKVFSEQQRPDVQENYRYEQSKWASQCLYQCQKCDFCTRLRKKMMLHVRGVHKTTVKSYIEEYGKLETRAKHVQCQLCHKSILHDYIALSNHLVQHGTTLADYYHTYVKEKVGVSSGQQPQGVKEGEIVVEGATDIVQVANHASTDQYFPPEEDSCTVEQFRVVEDGDGDIEVVAGGGEDGIEVVGEGGDSGMEAAGDCIEVASDNIETVPGNIEAAAGGEEGGSSQIQFRDHVSWSNQCLLQCRKCNFRVNGKFAIRYHVKTKHNLLYKTYVDKYGDPMIQSKFDVCKICGQKVLLDNTTLNNHMMTHAISVQKYYEQYVAEKQVAVVVPAVSTDDGRQSASRDSSVCRLSTEDGSDSAGVEPRAADELGDERPVGRIENGLSHLDGLDDMTWSNQCYYHCVECSYHTKSRSSIMEHSKRKHGRMLTLSLIDSQYMTQKRSVQCQICSKVLLHDRKMLRDHCYFNHKRLNLTDYFNQYVAKTSAPAPLPGMAPAAPIPGTRANPQSLPPPPPLTLGKRPPSQQFNNVAAPFDEPLLPTTATKRHNTISCTFDWNQCLLSCFVCHKSYTSVKARDQHVSQVHKTSMRQAPANQTGPNFNRNHRCRVCDREILFQKFNVNLHLKNQHSLTLLEYENRYHADLANEFQLLGLESLPMALFGDEHAAGEVGGDALDMQGAYANELAGYDDNLDGHGQVDDDNFNLLSYTLQNGARAGEELSAFVKIEPSGYNDGNLMMETE